MRHQGLASSLLGLAVTAASPAAHADVTRCANGDANLNFSVNDIPTESGDTGWFPDDPTAQLRITGRIVGETTVAMGVAPTACWSAANGMAVAAPAQSQTGLLDAEYGAELHVYGQIHTSVLGYDIDWEGEIPIPFLPTDLLLADTSAFDGTLLPDGTPNIVSASDTTSRITVLTTDILSDIIDITGISGGLTVYVQGEMTSTYATSAINVGAPITQTAGTIPMTMPAGGYGPSLTVAAPSANGDVIYNPALILGVTFAVKIFGITVANFDLASVQMPITTIDRPITLNAGDVTIPLPHLDTVPATLGFADGGTQPLHLHNSGLAPLMFELASGPEGVTVAPVTIAPGADGDVVVVSAGGAPANVEALVLSTNDPNLDTITISLDPATTGQSTTPPEDDSSKAGCNASHGGGSMVLVFGMLAGVTLISRKRR